jgi:hypothetical protein
MGDRRAWAKATRIDGPNGGVHCYIKGEVLVVALREAGIDEDCRTLVMRTTYLGECANRVASVLVEFKEDEEAEKRRFSV